MAQVESVPRHVAIIPDGNRRWAKQRGWDLARTYVHASRVLDRSIDLLVDSGVEYITIWPIAPRNFRRDMTEIYPVIEAIQDYASFAIETYPRRGYRAHTIGTLDRMRQLSPSLAASIDALIEATASGDKAHVVIAFDYSGRDEVVRAVVRMLEAGVRHNEISSELLGRHLDTAGMPDPDLIVRTGGDRRLSGFLSYQAEYAEIHFTGTLLPDLEEEEMVQILEQYAARRYSQ